jgi:hypothetical protein
MMGHVVVFIFCVFAAVITGMGLNNRDRYNSDTSEKENNNGGAHNE